MDATPPGAAGMASRPSRPTPAGAPLLLRRLAIGLAGLAVAVLTGAACALSFDDLRALAITGHAQPRLAYLYPTAFDALLVVALVSVLLLGGGRLLVRLQASLVLLLLLAAAAAATVASAAGATFDPRQAAIVVALLPWVMLALGLWMLLILLKHARASRADLDDVADAGEIVPFDGERESRRVSAAQGPTAPYTVVPEAVAPPDYAPPLPVSPVAETVAPPEYAPPLPVTPTSESGHDANSPFGGRDADTGGLDVDTDAEPRQPHVEAESETGRPNVGGGSAPGRPLVGVESDDDYAPPADSEAAEPDVMPVVPPTAAPQTPPVDELPPLGTLPPPSEPARPTAPKRNRPIRWGDFVRPHTGDVLVHPRPKGPGETPAQEEAPSAPGTSTPAAEEEAPGGQDSPSGRDRTPETAAETQPLREEDQPGAAVPIVAASDEASAELSRRYGEAAEAIARRYSQPRPEVPEAPVTASEPDSDAPEAAPAAEEAAHAAEAASVASQPADYANGADGATEAPAAASKPEFGSPEASAAPSLSPEMDDSSQADESLETDETGVDTQPMRQIRDALAHGPDAAHAPDPAHAAEVADPDERTATRRQPYDSRAGAPAVDDAPGTGTGTEDGVPLAPPSGRMRSTPRPPT
ncbi:DUF2637 domain-containing protein [Planotetraspora sp. GP83]|uniref:DUF2637 domain-containing protein n=1 Tax=Planotetraspora sp. GP83 TaxID=3156264 RepID=UPI0035188FEA